MNTQFKRNKSGKVDVSFKGMTQGEALSLCNALMKHSFKSGVAADLVASLRNAVQPDVSLIHREANQDLFHSLVD
jgi:hypothetical protein